MSFILDALKKSENERQRQIGPSLADVPVRRARTDRPWWAVAVAGLLVVNLGVLLIVLTRDGTRSAPQAPASQSTVIATQPSPSQQQPSAAARQAPAATNPAVHSLAEAASSDSMMPSDAPYDPSIAGAAAVPDGPPVVRQITPPTVTPLPNDPTFAARARNEAAGNDDSLPTHGGLVASGTNLPELRLDIHVYSVNPKERFVFVNMHKYTEGQALAEGPLVERITSDGAILNQNGMRFVLPRQ